MKGFDDGVWQSRLLIFGYSPVFEIALKRTAFRKLDLFPSLGDGMGHTDSVVSIRKS
jgi:hypothetical protein